MPEQLLITDETSLLRKRMYERAFIDKEVKSSQGFKVCVGTPCDLSTTKKSRNDAFL